MRIVKKYGTVLIALFILLVAVATMSIWMENESLTDDLAFQIICEDKEEEIAVWSDENEASFVFLPAYANLQSVHIVLDTQSAFYLNGNILENGMNCSEFQLNVPYILSNTTWEKGWETTLTFLQSSNVPTMYIDTQSGSMDYIHGTRGNEETGQVRIYWPDGLLDYSGEIKSCAGRGNSTWDQYEKKPYDIKLEQQGNLLGMGAAEKWILLANASDASHMRNKIAYVFADDAQMPYSPESQWVELYLNGTYAGLYLLCEKNEIHTERIDIGSDGTFLVSQEAEGRLLSKKIPYIKTQNSQILRIREANLPVEEVEMIWQSAENAIVSKDGYDIVSGKAWDEWIDMDSWARKYLIEELFGNIDAGFSSEYFYYSPDTAKIYAGPVWDYDYAMYDSHAFFARRTHVQVDVPTLWYPSLLDKPVFQAYVEQLYTEEFVPLAEQLLSEGIDRYQKQIEASARMDCIRWGRDPEEFQISVNGLKTYFKERTSFLTSAWIDEQDYCYVEVDNRLGRNIVIYTLKPGDNLEQILADLAGSSNTLIGWYDLETNSKIDVSEPVVRDMAVYASWSTMGMSRYLPILLPIGLIGVIFLGVFAMDMKRNKGRWRR